jgi:type I restriction enzyme, S subunit
MNRWETKKLGEISRVIMGQSPPGETYNTRGDGLPFFQGKAEFGEVSPNPVKWCNTPLKIAEAGDILLSVRAPVGPTNIAPSRCCIGRGLAAIRSDRRLLLTSFLRYYLIAFEDSLRRLGTGSTFEAIGRNDIESFLIPLPPLPEQERIILLLSEADQLRQLRAEADRRNADLVPAIFHQMFRPIDQCEPATLPLEQACVSPGGIKAGPFGSSLKKESYTSEGPRVYGQEQVIAGNFLVGDYHISRAKYEEMAAYSVRPGDLLISLVGTFGRTVIVPQDVEPGIINPRLIRIRVDQRKILPNFLKHYLDLEEAQAELQSLARGQTMGVLSAGILKNLNIPVPSIGQQRLFVARIAEFHIMHGRQDIAKQCLNHLFQSLLHRAFQGEL